MPLYLCAILFLGISLLNVRAEDTPRSSFRKGLKAYRAGDYTNAVKHLEKTALEFPAVGQYDLGNAHYRNGDFSAAADAFNEALRSENLELQAKAYFNRGCAMLARTTTLPGQDQIGRAIELAFQSMDMFEKAILLRPDDLEAKQNYERAQQLRLKLEYNLGRFHYDQAESLLQEFKAKDARSHYQLARKQFLHILEDIDPDHGEAQQYLPKVEKRLEMLRKAVVATEHNLEIALSQIDDYQYLMAAKLLTTESDAKKYALDIKPDLKKKYEETIEKNSKIWDILKQDNTLNVAE